MANDMEKQHLFSAAQEGDVEFLQEALATQPDEYFLPRTKTKTFEEHHNILHIAVLNEQVEFLKEALVKLPNLTVQKLLIQQDISYFNYNPFHCAALRGNLTIVKLIVEFYKSLSSTSSSDVPVAPDCKSWLAGDVNGKTPLLVALDRRREECALEIMSLDAELLCNIVDCKGISPLYEAVQRGCARVALKILTFGCSYSTSGDDEFTPLHVVPHCSEELCRLLLDKHSEMLKKVNKNALTILHKWLMMGKLWPFQILLNREETSALRNDFLSLLCATEESTGNNPLHIAASTHNEGILQAVQLLVETYKKAYEKGEVLQSSPWNCENKDGNTPLIISLTQRNEKLSLFFLSVDMENLVISATKSALFCAVQHGCNEVAEEIVTLVDPSYFGLMQLKGDHDQNVLHVASNCTEKICNLLVENFPWLINEPDDHGKRPLDIASEVGNAWFVKILLTKDPSSITNAPFAWVEACKRGNLPAIHAFIDHSPDFRTLCLDKKNSPLHHIQLKSYKEYKDFLAHPLIREMKNMLDVNGATPLHRAVECQDILLAEALLTTAGVFRNVKDKNGKTAIDMLRELCNDYRWDEMCKRTEINPWLRTTYLSRQSMNPMIFDTDTIRGTTASAGEMRGTLSVVAALLATLTFAAGFTLPGGLNQENGEALLSKRVSFLVFIIADTYAMCSSMLVLFCLIWSMVGDRDKSFLLIDRSVVLLVQSLYGTLVAFMTGVYTVISHKSMWAAIMVIVMCSVVAISANRATLDKVLDKLIPSAKKDSVTERGYSISSAGVERYPRYVDYSNRVRGETNVTI